MFLLFLLNINRKRFATYSFDLGLSTCTSIDKKKTFLKVKSFVKFI